MDTASRPNPLAFLDDELAALRERHLYRPLRVMSSRPGPDRARSTTGGVISLSSNDYLGLTHHPRMKRGGRSRRSSEFGAGSGAVRTIAGTMTLHEALEAELAEFKAHRGRPDVPVRLHRQHRASSRRSPARPTSSSRDELNHASIIDGMRLSKAPRKVYPHADVDALREVLRRGRRAGPRRAAASRTG